MTVDLQTVRRVSHLARIKLTDDEAMQMTEELGNLLAFVEKLESVETEGVVPMVGVSHQGAPLREDVATDGNYAQEIMENAPLTQDNFFLVPKVIE